VTDAPQGSRAQRIISQSASSVATTGVVYASRLALTVALGKTLSTSEYGVYSVVAAAVGFIAIFLQLSAFTYYTVEIPGKPKDKGQTMFRSIVVFEAIYAIAILALCFLPPVREALADLLHIEPYSAVFAAVLALSFIEVFALEFKRYLAITKRIERSNVLLFLKESLWGWMLFGMWLVAPALIDLSSVLWLWALSGALGILWGILAFPVRDLVRPPVRPGLYIKAVQFGFPFLGAAAGQAALNFFDRFFLLQSQGADVAGVYAYQYKIVFMITAFVGPLLGNSVMPYFYEAFNLREFERASRYLTITVKYTFVIIVPVLLLVGMISQDLVRLLAQESYVADPMLTAILLLVPLLVFLNSQLQNVLLMERRRWLISGLTLVGAGANIGLNILLIPVLGSYGAAIATVLSFAALFVPMNYAVRHSEVRIEYGKARIPSTLIAGVVAAIPAAAAAFFLDGLLGLLLPAVILLPIYAFVQMRVMRIVAPEEAEVLGTFAKRIMARFGGSRG
jgi:O-antigen/teichoic acid export membrane protein